MGELHVLSGVDVGTKIRWIPIYIYGRVYQWTRSLSSHPGSEVTAFTVHTELTYSVKTLYITDHSTGMKVPPKDTSGPHRSTIIDASVKIDLTPGSSTSLASKLYPGCYVCGPYLNSVTRRKSVHIVREGRFVTGMLLSRFIKQEAEGRILSSDEHVDHIDEDVMNDDLMNLQILTPEQHNTKHAKRPSLAAATCQWCYETFEMSRQQQTNWIRQQKKGSAGPFCSKHCARKYQWR